MMQPYWVKALHEKLTQEDKSVAHAFGYIFRAGVWERYGDVESVLPNGLR